MPSTSVKNLYVAKSLEELQSCMLKVLDLKGRPTKGLVISARKVFEAAEKSHLEKDEEKAYIHYMRFIDLLLMLKKKPDFEKDPNYHWLLKSGNTAIGKAEYLKESLQKRYSILESAYMKKNDINELISGLNKTKSGITDTTSEVTILPDEPKEKEQKKNSISSTELRSLLTTISPSVIIMDTRPAKDFVESHIKYSHCISVPQEILNPGVTAAKLESLLPKESLSDWYKRSHVENIILIDWDSKDELTESSPLTALKQAMSKWDQTCTLKKTPLILQGGYKDWMLKYPMYTTHALSFDSMTDVRASPVIADLSAVEYPNLDENVVEKNNLPSNKENIEGPGILFKKSSVPSQVVNGFSPSDNVDFRKSKSAPTVDRKSKPNIDRGLKSSGTERKLASNNNILNQDGKKLSPSPESKSVAMVSRTSKPSVSSPVEKYCVDSDEVLVSSLNKEEFLAKENLELTKQQLRNEEEFEKLRLRKELEAEESKRIEIQKQEDILIEKLRQLELQSKEKDAAYLKIKEENFKMKKLLEEHSNIELRKKEKEITDALKKQKNLREDVERLREQRKKKEAEAKKKGEASKPNIQRESVSANTGLKRNINYPEQDAMKHPNSTEYSVPLSRQNSLDGCSRGLVRSHSSPNIAQMVNQEETVQRKVPTVDRSLKPKPMTNYQLNEINRARLRNLNPVYGNCPVRPATGLRNLGNTCFMNSIIQCLSNTIPLADYITSGQYMEDINRDNKHGTGGELAEEFAVVIRALWMGQYKSFSPKDFKNTVSKCLAVCIGNEQQDSHEFLVVLMDKLHADLNKKCRSVPKLESTVDENTFWLHHRSYNCSKISDIFEGLLKSTLTCLSCRKTSDNFEVFSCLSLPILTSRCSLKDCFQHFLKSEKIFGEAAWDCPRCKQKKEAEKRLRICRLPEVLVIQLKRFSYEGLWRRKLQTHVDFDLIFEVPCEENCEERPRSYSLYGIVNHYGTLEGGHYTAYCKASSYKWYKYDDHEVSEISVSDIKTAAAYLLFYRAVEFQSNL